MSDRSGDDTPPGPPAPEAAPEKPKVLQESTFIVEEGIAYRISRTGAIWMNKLFFGSLVLLGLWLLLGLTGAVDPGCADSIQVVEGGNGTGDQPAAKCSVLLSPTALYLGSMAFLSFALSIGFGMLGLVVGKNIVEATPRDDEVGAGGTHTPPATDAPADDEEADPPRDDET